MRATLLTTTILAMLTLSACSKPANRPGEPPVANAADASAHPKSATADGKASDAAADAAAPPGKTPAAPARPAPAARAASLAYAYATSLVVPARRIEGLQARHQAACAAAGPDLCQVTGSTYEARGRDDIHANLSLRAAPEWLAAFRRALGPDAAAAGGRIGHAALSSEDLARQVVDTEAAIRARTALRDRLQHELETRPGTPKDFDQVATDLAEVQGELDASQSELAQMRERLATSTLTIDYVSKGVFAADGTWAPLTSAVLGAGGVLSQTLGFMVTALAAITPWGLLIAAGVWIARHPRFRRKPGAPPTR